MVGVGTGPPKVVLAPKPTSSVRMRRTFGAPLGALTSCGKSLVDSSTVRPMCPLNGGSGRGNTSCARVAAANNEVTAVLTLVSNMLRLFTFACPTFVVSRKITPLREGLESLAARLSRSLPYTRRPRGPVLLRPVYVDSRHPLDVSIEQKRSFLTKTV